MKLLITFLIVFVVGPVIFWVMTRGRASRLHIASLMGLAILLMLVAFSLGHWLVPMMESSIYPGLGSLLASWLAWIAMLAYCALAVLRRWKSPRARKITLAIGAMATTLPWFGLYTAQMMAAR